ncbi:ABC transporter ATP-binding protein [Glycomyces algeriensis]|uniref:ABC transporter ATP-binding protein n=1 Tax=Glycomyces algeriensis TaxID=256037 RepID=A0A9W6LFG9_9ACTN|nr:ATP-binding cassette domain-containing protein [Glycomyces algeriensis]MDA1367226.1 ATP-binding cassette domain-containing protein [Glycomyces algeriensis]MDR7353390.1 peptide/nickel transport system ATP-binding protein [Glycomyces algeriensis]GLI41085.1 ABC transporter ATP-binding protein [Glycomyces algeriensis]
MSVHVTGLRAEAAGRTLVADVDFALDAGRVLAIVGASGSGKTTIGSALLGAVKPGVTATGTVEVAGVDVLTCAPGEVPAAYLPQHPAAVLNPVRRIGGVLTEIANARRLQPRRAGSALARAATAERISDAMRRVGLDDPAFLRRFPHQLSGGQQQRLVLAQAFLCEARLLVADEPTTGQDLGNRDRIAAELRLAAEGGMAVVLLSHDLELVAAVADDLLVLDAGRIAERGPAAQVLAEPRHDYTRRLLAALHPEPALAGDAQAPIRIAGRGLAVHVGSRRTRLLDGVDFEARQGECLAVLGASGSGKTTLARTIAGLQQAAAGALDLDGEPLPVRGRRRTRAERARVQYVFQDARASFDEHRSIAEQVARSAVRLRGLTPDQARAEAARVLADVALEPETAARRRDKLSGGQLQRAALARALAARPQVLVCDEITSGLDALTRNGVLDLLADLKTERGLTILLITHEPAVAARLADRVLRIEAGRAA